MQPVDPRQESGVWLIVGVQASGKSTVADRLARRYNRGVHIRGGQFYRWAVSGWAHPQMDHDPGPAVRAHLELRYRLSALVADEYASAGFMAVVQDNIFGADVVGWLDRIRSRPTRLTVLCPSTDVVRERDAARRTTTGKSAYAAQFTVEGLDLALRETPRIGLWVDSSHLTPDETVDQILTAADEALIR